MITKKEIRGGIIINPDCGLSYTLCGGLAKPTNLQLREQEVKVYKNLQDFKREEVGQNDLLNIADFIDNLGTKDCYFSILYLVGAAADRCHGFFVNEINIFITGNLRPIR